MRHSINRQQLILLICTMVISQYLMGITFPEEINKETYVDGQVIVRIKNKTDLCLFADVLYRNHIDYNNFAETQLDEIFKKYNVVSVKRMFPLPVNLSPLPKDIPAIKTWITKNNSVIATAQKHMIEGIRNTFYRRSLRRQKDINTDLLLGYYYIEFENKGFSSKDVADALQTDPLIAVAEPNDIINNTGTDLPEVQNIPQDFYLTQDGVHFADGAWDQVYDNLWGLKMIKALEAWNDFPDPVHGPGQDIIIAVVDTGMDYRHSELVGRVWENINEIGQNGIDDDHNGMIDDVYGFDFSRSRDENGDGDFVDAQDRNHPDPMDDNGHGTVVSGIIASEANNADGLIGVAFQSKIMILKARNAFGQGSALSHARAIVYASDNGADIINNSWGPARSGSIPHVLRDAIAYAQGQGCIMVASSGNADMDIGNEEGGHFPACLRDVIAVGAVNRSGQKSEFSNFGETLDIVAPGGGKRCDDVRLCQYSILSCAASNAMNRLDHPDRIVDGYYYRDQGTSMSSAYVSGVVALILSRYPEKNFSSEMIRFILRHSAQDVVDPLGEGMADHIGFDSYTGYGIVDALEALVLAGSDQLLDTPDLRLTMEGNSSHVLFQSGGVDLVFHIENVGMIESALTDLKGYLQTEDGLQLAFSSELGVLHPGEGQRIQIHLEYNQTGTYQYECVVNENARIRELTQENNHATVSVHVTDYQLVVMNLTQDDSVQESPAVHDQRVVWYEPNHGIVELDLNTREQRLLFDLQSAVMNIDMNEEEIAFIANNGRDYRFDVLGYHFQQDRLSQWTQNATFEREPKLTENGIVWLSGADHEVREIHIQSFLQDQPRRVMRGQVGDIDANANNIVWVHKDFQLGDFIERYDLDANRLHVMVMNDGAGKTCPRISNESLVWIDYRNGGQIWKKDLLGNEEKILVKTPSGKSDLEFSDGLLIWRDDRLPRVNEVEDAKNIFLFDESLNAAYALHPGQEDQKDPYVSGNKVVWIQGEDVYMAVLNHMPVLQPVQSFELQIGQRLMRMIQADDSDQDRLRFQVRGLPPGVFAVPLFASNRLILVGTPLIAGHYQISIIAEDPYHGRHERAFKITVNPFRPWQIRRIIQRIWER
ncbi:MAG: S8 family peptidase [Chlamydiota bacterium]|nr:S8 family peptidase [Chlamydiota bacterium]